MVMEKGWFLVP